jgi:transcriptional regulator with XRE-family HTH domain
MSCYISRVENGHTVPAVETLEKFARALEVPMYELFYDGEEPPKPLDAPKQKSGATHPRGSLRRDAALRQKARRLLSRIDETDLALLLLMAQKMARKKTV